MRTLLRSEKREVVVDTESTFTVIGEKINPTGRKKLAEALATRDHDYICRLARQQVDAGADVLDVNVGAPGIDDGRGWPGRPGNEDRNRSHCSEAPGMTDIAG